MLQVYVDDSGGKGQGPILTFAGLVSSAEQWASFSDEWAECLEERPAIRYFKMREAASLSGEFAGMRGEFRDRKLRALVELVNRSAPAAIYSSVNLGSFAETIAVVSTKPLSQPYFLPFHLLILAACDHLFESGAREEVEFIF